VSFDALEIEFRMCVLFRLHNFYRTPEILWELLELPDLLAAIRGPTLEEGKGRG